MTPDAYNAEILKTHHEILATLKQILVVLKKAPAASAGGSSGPNVASDSDLDGQYGDPTIKKDPPKWEGESFAGMPYSYTTAEYLESLAGFLEWKAGKDDKSDKPEAAKYARYARIDAARARGWAQRIRNGYKPPQRQGGEQQSGGQSGGYDEDPPF